MGTITDIYTVLRQLFSRVGQPFVGYPNVFSFNEPLGMCPECNGLGRKLQPIAEKFYDPSKSLREGAIQGLYSATAFMVAASLITTETSEFTKEEMDLLLYGEQIQDGQNDAPTSADHRFPRSTSARPENTLERTQERWRNITPRPLSRLQGLPPTRRAELQNQRVQHRRASSMKWAAVSVIKGVKGAVAKPMWTTGGPVENVVDIGLEYLTSTADGPLRRRSLHQDGEAAEQA
jgi:hypothetical protein